MPWLRKAYVPIALCHWVMFPYESLTSSGSATMSFSLPGLLRPKLKWGTAIQNCHRTFLSKHVVTFLPEKDAQEWQKPDLTEFIAIQLCICFSKTKLQMRACCHSFSREPSTLWLNFQAVWTHPGSSVGLALFCDESSRSYDVNKSKPQHMWLQHWENLYNNGIVCLGIHTYTHTHTKKTS